MVNGIMGVYINWLARPENISENELIVILSEMLEHNLTAEASSQLDDILNAQEEFDFLLFFSELNQIMKSHLSFYQIIAQKNAYVYLIKDFSRILEKGLSKHYLKNHSTLINLRGLKS